MCRLADTSPRIFLWPQCWDHKHVLPHWALYVLWWIVSLIQPRVTLQESFNKGLSTMGWSVSMSMGGVIFIKLIDVEDQVHCGGHNSLGRESWMMWVKTSFKMSTNQANKWTCMCLLPSPVDWSEVTSAWSPCHLESVLCWIVTWNCGLKAKQPFLPQTSRCQGNSSQQ